MGATELRIGNYHESNSIDIPREGIRSIRINGKAFSSISGYGIYLAEQGKLKVKPIPLTEEWLLKFGFTYLPNKDYMEIGVSPKSSNWLSLNVKTMTSNIMLHSIKLEYVHQLQNLYFTLTEKELTIN